MCWGQSTGKHAMRCDAMSTKLGVVWRGQDIQWHCARCGEAMTSTGTELVVERP